MAVNPQYLAYVLEQLAGMRGLRSRRMFGAVGLYSGELFFGLVDDDALFLKTDGATREAYVARGMPRFMPFPERPGAVLSYHQVPADVIEDGEELLAWARRATGVALEARTAAPRARPRATRRKRPVARKKVARRAK